MNVDRAKRVQVANQFLLIISSYGRRFFSYKGRVSRFELDHRGRVWFIDCWKGSRIYTHRPPGHYWGWEFSQGGSLQVLCIELVQFIMHRTGLPVWCLGRSGSPDQWGYGDRAMEAVRRECSALAKGDTP